MPAEVPFGPSNLGPAVGLPRLLAFGSLAFPSDLRLENLFPRACSTCKKIRFTDRQVSVT